MALQVQHNIPRTDIARWPTPSDDAGWSDPNIAVRLGHPSVHPVPQPGCDLCPPVPCRCGTTACPEVFEHSRTYAGAEITAWEMAA
ncbi:hypothetical protein ACH4T9_12280 [Micromonospora sp. NPDC020750]|uniref:hypothetical protein n=1 Tax=unclassified Micromonospora TaxID=2617518 RepID=UPI0037A06F6E